MPDDDVIDEGEPQQLCPLAQVAGEVSVRIAGRGITGGMIVCDHKAKGSIREHLFQDLARMRYALIEAALEHALTMDEAELGIEQQHMNLFMIERLHLAGEVVKDEFGLVHRLIAHGFTSGALTNLKGSGEHGGFRWAEAFGCLQVSHIPPR